MKQLQLSLLYLLKFTSEIQDQHCQTSVLLNSCVLTTACLARKDPFPISGSYFCSPRMCFWSCLSCIMYYSKYNISRCQCSFWTKLSVVQKKMVTATTEKYWTLFSKIRVLSKCTVLGLAWYGLTWSGLERCTEIRTWTVWVALDSLIFLDFLEFGDSLLWKNLLW